MGHSDEGIAPVPRFVRLRWVAAACALGALWVARLLRPELALGPAFVVASLIPITNVVHYVLARRGLPSRVLLLSQFSADLVLLTVLVGTVGGVDGPLIPLYLLHVVLAALLLERRDAIAVATFSVTLASAIAALQIAGAPFPIRSVAVYSALLGLELPLARQAPFVVGQVVVLALVGVVMLALLLPVAGDAKRRAELLKDAAARAREQIAALERILESTGAMMMVLDSEHRLTWFNRAARDRLPGLEIGKQRRCYDPAEPMGGGDRPGCPSCHVLRTGQIWKGDYALAIPGGGQACVWRVFATPLLSAGATDRVLELVVDVTEERENAARLVEAQKTAGIAQLAAGVAHEMNTPLASIAAGLHSLRRLCESACGEERPERTRMLSLLQDLRAQTVRCQGITESLLGYSRQLRSRLDSAEIDRIIRGAITDLGSKRALSAIEVLYEAPSGGVPTVQCDPDHLRLVLVNLLTNAVDAVRDAHRSQGRVRIDVHVPEPRDVVDIQVTDNGAGIAQDIRDHVFEPFFTTKRTGAGTGLGLAVSRSLLEDMGARLSIESDADRGAKVHVRLRAADGTPRAPGSAPAATDLGDEREQHA